MLYRRVLNRLAVRCRRHVLLARMPGRFGNLRYGRLGGLRYGRWGSPPVTGNRQELRASWARDLLSRPFTIGSQMLSAMGTWKFHAHHMLTLLRFALRFCHHVVVTRFR